MSRLSSLGLLAEVERHAAEAAVADPVEAFRIGVRLALTALPELADADADGALSAPEVLALATEIVRRLGGSTSPDA